jgi:hypothetical protein
LFPQNGGTYLHWGILKCLGTLGTLGTL